MAGMVRRSTDDQDSGPTWRKALLGIISGVIIATISGVASGMLSSYIVLKEHAVKLDTLNSRIQEDRQENRERFHDVNTRLLYIERKR